MNKAETAEAVMLQLTYLKGCVDSVTFDSDTSRKDFIHEHFNEVKENLIEIFKEFSETDLS